MDVLHRREEATAAEVRAAMPKPLGYSAVRAQLRILEEKGYVKHRQEGARYVFAPRESRQTAGRSALKRILATFFNGAVEHAVAGLLDAADKKLSPAELEKLQDVIKQAGKEGR